MDRYLHPPLTGFPFVLLSCVMALELSAAILKKEELGRMARFLLGVACLVTPLTFFSGYFAAEYASQTFQVAQDRIAEHQAAGKLLLLSLIPTFVFSSLRKSQASPRVVQCLFFVSLSCSLYLVLLTSSRGGDLVFRHGAGVFAKPPAESE